MEVGGPIDYLELTRQGLRSVMSKALSHVAEHGLHGEQHFFLTLLSGHPGVVMPDWLRARYPDEITIVLQFEFTDLAVMNDRFSVELTFNGRAATMVVPFSSVRTFADPSVNFRIDIPLDEDELAGAGDSDGVDEPDTDEAEAAEPAPQPEGTVVSLDSFRKK